MHYHIRRPIVRLTKITKSTPSRKLFSRPLPKENPTSYQRFMQLIHFIKLFKQFSANVLFVYSKF